MAAPWERYQQQKAPPQDGPWARYGATPPKTMEELTPGLSTNPTDGMSFGQQAAAGAGKSVRDTFFGAIQSMGDGGVVGSATRSGLDAVGIDAPENPMSAWARDKVAETAQADQQLLDTGGGLTGNLTGQVGQMLVPGAGLTRAGMIAQGAPRLLLAGGEAGAFANLQPVDTDAGRLMNVAGSSVGGAVGQKVGDKLFGAAARARDALTPQTARLQKLARDAGMKVGVPELTENAGVKLVLDQLGRLPLSGSRARNEANVKAFNRALSREIGEDADAITPEVFAKAQGRIGAEFDRLTDELELPATPQLVQRLSAVADEADSFAVGDLGRVLRNHISDLLSKADERGVIPGQAFKSFESRLSKKTTEPGEVGEYARQLLTQAREAAGEAMGGANKQAWQEANRQYANLMTIMPLVAKDAGQGISPQALLSRTTANNAGKRRMASGRGGDIGDLARIGQQFYRKPPDSGTADRFLVNLGVLTGLGGAQHQGWIDPQTAGIGAGILLANRGLQRAAGSNALGRLVSGDLPPQATGLLRLLARPTGYTAGALAPSAAGAFDIGMVTDRYPEDLEDARYRR